MGRKKPSADSLQQASKISDLAAPQGQNSIFIQTGKPDPRETAKNRVDEYPISGKRFKKVAQIGGISRVTQKWSQPKNLLYCAKR